MNIMRPDNYDDRDLIEFIGQQESQNIETGIYYSDQIANRLKNGKVLKGHRLPWGHAREKIAFNGGQVTIWAGYNGHMKSMVLGQIMMWMARKTKVGIASFEMPVIDTIERMIYQAAGCTPSVEFGQQWAEWSDNRIYLYDQLDTVPAERVLGVIFWMASELGVKHVMIDSLAKCGLAYGDGNAEKRFIDTLAATAKALNIHIHLVTHLRKPSNSTIGKMPDKYDVKGAGEITDLVDNVIIFWMDKKAAKLKQLQRAGNTLTDDENDYLINHPTHRLVCEKQRHWGFEGTIPLWFDDNSLQFTGDASGKVLPFNIQQGEML